MGTRGGCIGGNTGIGTDVGNLCEFQEVAAGSFPDTETEPRRTGLRLSGVTRSILTEEIDGPACRKCFFVEC